MSCKIHNLRFYNFEPRAIHCMVLNTDSKTLAVSRNDASIELWDVKDLPFISRVIPGTPSGSVEAMCWVGDRLLSTGLSGAVVEWNLKTLSPKRSVLVTGQAAWCIDVTNAMSKIAVGTEQGYVNIYSVENDSIDYERIFDKQQGRILCCKFDPSGEILVTGSIETLRIWNVRSGQALHRMGTGRAERNRETIVWCLAVTSDLTIISGDSRGRLTFWDARVGEQIESVVTHRSDLLAICLSNDERSLYCAGVDPLIINFTKVRMKHRGEDKHIEKWVKNIQRNIHQHDVRGLVLHNEKLFSAGVDGYLAMSSFPPKLLVKYPPLLQQPSVIICHEARLACLRYASSIELWGLGSALSDNQGKTRYTTDEEPAVENGSLVIPSGFMNGEKETYSNDSTDTRSERRLRLAEGSQLLLRLATPSSAPLVCYAVAPNAKLIAYSTETHFRIFKFSMDDESPMLSRIVPLPEECAPCYRMAFSPDSKSLIVSSADCIIRIIHIHSDGAITVGETIATEKALKDATLLHLNVSRSSKKTFYFIVAADANSNIAVWKVNNGEDSNAQLLAQLPSYTNPPTAICVDSHSDYLLVTYSDQKIIEYCLTEMRFTKFSKRLRGELELGPKWFGRLFPITRIDVHPSNPNLIMLHDDCAVYIINRAAEPSQESDPKKSRKSNHIKESAKLCFTVKKYKHLVAAGWLSDDEAFVVVVEPDSLIEKLPPMLIKKRFGAK